MEPGEGHVGLDDNNLVHLDGWHGSIRKLVLLHSGVAFRSATEPFETATPAGRLLFSLLGSIGEFERNTMVENVKMGMNQRAKGGQWNGGRVLGYASVAEAAGREETVLTVVPDEAAVVRHIFKLYAGGKGLKAITTRLNREGYKTKTGIAFSPQAVGLILDNPIYVGKIRYGSHRDWSSKRRRGKTEPIVADGHHEPIVSPELWAQVEALRKRKSTRPSRTFDGQYLLTGLMRCPACGATMVASRTKNRLKDGSFVIRRYYVCGNHRNKGATVCRAHGVNAGTIEDAVMARIRAAVERPKVLRDVVRRINDSGAHAPGA